MCGRRRGCLPTHRAQYLEIQNVENQQRYVRLHQKKSCVMLSLVNTAVRTMQLLFITCDVVFGHNPGMSIIF